MASQQARDEYLKALKAAAKEQKERHAAGLPTSPAVLDEILPDGSSEMYQDVGMVEIPIDRVVGTKSAGRITAFTAGFLPLLNEESEFAIKWMALCDAHLSDEGIRDPILVYEYLGLF